MINLTELQGSQVLLAGMQLPPNYGPYYTNRFKAIYQELAAQYAIPLVPFFLEDVGGVDALIQSDGLHPNAKAQSIILDNVWTHLEPLLNTN
jgi:acyl-CoA thioesterase-1